MSLGIAAAGCSRPAGSGANGGGATRQAAATKPVPAYVRLTALERFHPLQADVARLVVARQRLLSLLPAGARGGSGAGLTDPYALPPLAAREDTGMLRRVRAGLDGGRQRARALLLAQAARQMDAYLQETDYRQERLLAQRRSELEAAGQAQQERLAQEIRDQSAAAVHDQIAAKTPDLVNRQIQLRVIDAQLADSQQAYTPTQGDIAALGRLAPTNPQPVVIMPPVLDRATLDADIKKLEADPGAGGVSMRARYTLKRTKALERLRALRAEIDTMNLQGKQASDVRIRAIQDARLAEIEAELESLRDDTDSLFLVRSQRAALARTMEAEAALARRTEVSLFPETGTGNHPVAGETRFTSLFGKAPNVGGSVSASLDVRRAVARVDAQRVQLERFIVADVRDAVRDAAEAHGVDVAFAPGPRREDMTSSFAVWTGLQSRGAPGGKVSAGAAGG